MFLPAPNALGPEVRSERYALYSEGLGHVNANRRDGAGAKSRIQMRILVALTQKGLFTTASRRALAPDLENPKRRQFS